MKKGTIFLIKFLGIITLSGCVNNPMLPSHFNHTSTQKALIFKTNQSTFITELNNTSDKNTRNSYINEFLLKSDIQCRDYLNAPEKSSQINQNENQLYMNIFDAISTAFGLSYITNTAKTMLSSENNSNLENQQAYKKALSPEIQRGVEINRERYAQKIKSKMMLSIKKYPISQVRKDMLTYDKQCNEAYGLIEINRALKAMRQNLNHPVENTKTAINLEAVKKSVTQTTKKVQAKKKLKIKSREKNATK
jgi:hypothetical protein